MAECIFYVGGGSGVYSDDLTATAAHVYPGRVYVGQDTGDETLVGTMATTDVSGINADSVAETIAAANTYCLNNVTISALSHSNLTAENVRAGATVIINNGREDVYTVSGTYTSDANAEESHILAGETAGVNGEVKTGNIATKASQVYYAGSASQTIGESGKMNLAQTIGALAQTNLSSGNIRHGSTISISNGKENVFSETGTFSSDATATSEYVYPGKTIAAGGTIVTGQMATKTAATFYATTSTQQIAASGRNCEVQTIGAMAATNLAASNIRNGVVVSVSNGSTNVWTPVTGTFTSDANVAATQVYTGKTVGGKGTIVDGKMPAQAEKTFYATTVTQQIAAAGRCCAAQTIAAVTHTNLKSEYIKNGVTITISNGSGTIWNPKGTFASEANVAATEIYSGKKAWNASTLLTGSMALKGAASYTPKTTDQIIASGVYLTGAQTVVGAATLQSSNIRTGITIAGIQGNVADYTASQATWVNPS